MSGIINTIIIITIILVLILAFILISFFYNNYDENKQIVNSNFKKTATYINDTNNMINENISLIDNKTSNFDNKYNLIVNRTDSNLINVASNLNNYKNEINPKFLNINSNLFNYDNSLKQFFNFKNNNTSINDKLYEYNFGVQPNLSMSLLRNIDVASGMTINTNDSKNFRVCDFGNNSNCIDLNVNNGNFNIYPSSTGNNNLNNLNIMSSNSGKVLANFNFNSKSIYLGGAGEEAGMFINESNVFLKNLNLLSNNARYSDTKTYYDINNPSQSFNTYKYNVGDITKITKIITGKYSLYSITIDTTTTTHLDVFIKSKNLIPIGTNISFEVNEITPSTGSPITIANDSTKGGSVGLLSGLTLTGKILSGIIANNINPNTTIFFKYAGTGISILNDTFPGKNYSGTFTIEF